METNRMKLAYLAHPVAGDVERNVANAKLWLKALTRSLPRDVYLLAPWLFDVDGTTGLREPDDRALGLERNLAVVARCDLLILAGPRLSAGMRLEAEHALAHGLELWTVLAQPLTAYRPLALGVGEYQDLARRSVLGEQNATSEPERENGAYVFLEDSRT